VVLTYESLLFALGIDEKNLLFLVKTDAKKDFHILGSIV
jgi:hypothetical protein